MSTLEPENPIRLLEELSMNAWPSLQTVYDDGWVLRLADGYTRRANAVYPLYPSMGDVEAKIQRCENWYASRRQDTVFKLTPLSLPKELDALLARRNYHEESGASVQVRPLETLDQPTHEAITFTPQPDESWLTAFCQMRDLPAHRLPTMRRRLGSIAPQTAFATMHQGQAVVALGLAVVDRGWVGLFDIVTAPEWRRRGFGRQIVLRLLQWGKTNGATQAYLQVAPANEAAVTLYTALGFEEVYQYWYRVK